MHAPIGIFFGRIANFINSELYGKPTGGTWGVVFPNIDNVLRHPSQIYEAILEGVLLFIILKTIIFLKKYSLSFCSSMFLIFYGFFRIVAEQYRVPDQQLGMILDFISMGSLLSLLMIIAGFILIFLKINSMKEIFKKKKISVDQFLKEFYMTINRLLLKKNFGKEEII